MASNPIPHDGAVDSTLALGREGYEFFLNRSRRLGSDLFRTRLMMRTHICMTGAEAARLFYDESRFVRRGAVPRRVKATLLGSGGVQELNGEAHRARKRMFMELMTPASIARLGALVEDRWRVAARGWARAPRVVLYEEVKEILARSVCAWAAVPLSEAEAARRTRDLALLFESAAAVGPQHWRGRAARSRCERWLAGLVESARESAAVGRGGSTLYGVAAHREPHGAPLSPKVAAVEVLNVLRPTVAVAVYVAFVALALHRHPEVRQRIAAGDEALLDSFVQEVRRFYPFFPFVGARVRESFEWRGFAFPAGTRVLLDLYGTNHDPRLWERPGEFLPERFLGREIDPYHLIPQGGGDPHAQHRCAGEWITLELMRRAARLLAGGMTYRVPEQDLRVRMNRIPAVPESGFVMEQVRTAA